MTGKVTDIERYAINDGFGLRTTVFLKGCPLRCKWCSNPETQEFYPEMVFFGDKCIDCGACKVLCLYGALENGLEAERSICKECYMRKEAFACVRKCYPKCRKVVGENKSVEDVLDVVKRDLPFYRRSGGGVTLSGGEPMAQPEFVLALLKAFSENWIDTAIETCGIGETQHYEKIAPWLDFAFIDLKHVESEKHKEWTGVGNEKIKKNIVRMDQLSGEFGFELIIRTPVIPGFNDTKEDTAKIAEFVSENCKHYKGMELLPYHKLGRGKYTCLGREYELEDFKIPSEQYMMELNGILERQGIPIYKF